MKTIPVNQNQWMGQFHVSHPQAPSTTVLSVLALVHHNMRTQQRPHHTIHHLAPIIGLEKLINFLW